MNSSETDEPRSTAPPGEDVGSLAELLHETAQHHDKYEKVAPAHDWWDWYAAYLYARRTGVSPGDATKAADQYMADVKHIHVVAT